MTPGVPAKRCFVLLAVAAAAAVLSPGLAWVLAFAIAALVALDLVLARRTQRLELTLDAPPVLSQTVVSQVTLRVENRGGGTATARLALDLPPALAGEGAHAMQSLVVAPKQRGALDFALVARERGVFELTAAHVRELSPLRLWWRQRIVPLGHTLEVRPLVALERRGDTRSAQRPWLGRHTIRARGDRGEFESLKSYVRGDDPRRLDWKATAKRRALTVRSYQDERSQSLMLVVDAGRLMVDRIDGLARLDWAVAAAAALAGAARAWHDAIGLMVFADEVQAFLPPGHHPADRIARLLTRATARRVEPNYPRALVTLSRALKRRSLIVLLGDVIDHEVSAPVAAHLGQLAGRHLPLFVALRHPELAAQAAAPVTDRLTLMRRAAAIELLLARQKTLEAMRQGGIRVVDVLPSASLEAVVEQYVRIKRGGAL